MSSSRSQRTDAGCFLFERQARDYALFWQQTPVELRSDATCAHALREMAAAGAEIHTMMVFETSGPTSEVRSYNGLLSTGNFLRYAVQVNRSEPPIPIISLKLTYFACRPLASVSS